MSDLTTIHALDIASGVASLASVAGAIVAAAIAPEILPVVAVGAAVAAVSRFTASHLKHRVIEGSVDRQEVVARTSTF